jgi:hypothetical protein
LAVVFLAVVFLAVVFLAVVFLAVVFFAGACFEGVLLVEARAPAVVVLDVAGLAVVLDVAGLAPDFLAVVFLAGDVLATALPAGFFDRPAAALVAGLFCAAIRAGLSRGIADFLRIAVP